MRSFIAAFIAFSLVFGAVPTLASTTDFVVVRHQYDDLTGDNTLQAHCPSDRPVPTGGGFSLSPNQNTIPIDIVWENYPQLGTPGMWKLVVSIPSGDSYSIIVYAVCTSGTSAYYDE